MATVSKAAAKKMAKGIAGGWIRANIDQGAGWELPTEVYNALKELADELIEKGVPVPEDARV